MIRPGCRLGIDAGQARIGLAACDDQAILAWPLLTLRRANDDDAAAAGQIASLAEQHRAVELVVGWPTHLSGGRGQAAEAAEALAVALARVQPRPVRLIDERLTTVQATNQLLQAGLSTRRHRAVIDQAAAVLILQSALDTERSTGRPAGRLVEPPSQLDAALSASGLDCPETPAGPAERVTDE